MGEPDSRHIPEIDGIKTRHPRFLSLDRGCACYTQELWGLVWRACNPSYLGGCGRRLEVQGLLGVQRDLGANLDNLVRTVSKQASKQASKQKNK